MISRNIVLEKLSDYLEGRITKENAHSWALGCAMSQDYKNVIQNDALIAKTIQSLIDIDRKSIDKKPSVRSLEYYRLCLSGDMIFDPLHVDLDDIGAPDPIAITPKPEKPKRKKSRINNRVLMRLYVLFFALSSLGFQLLVIINPSFMQPEGGPSSGIEILTETLPHILYALVLLIPPHVASLGALFFVSLSAYMIGMMFYTYVSVTMIMKLSLNLMFILVILPFGTLPAVLAIWLLLHARKEK